MKFIAIILALFVAFPNMGYALVDDCCSHEQIVQENCEDIGHELNTDHQHSEEGDSEPCSSQCDCSCCMHTFLIAETKNLSDKIILVIKNESPISSGSSFSLGFYNLIWQPPQLS